MPAVPPASFPFRAVIFDMDGVIVDTEAYYTEELGAYARYLGIEVSRDELNEQVGKSHQDFCALMVDWLGRAGRTATVAKALDAYEAWVADKPCDYAALLNPGAAETFAGLRERGVRVALASSSPLANIHTVLKACGLEGAFEVITSGEQFEQSKPDPEIYLHTLDVLGLPASACCCVEDSVPGITAGKAAGLTVIAKREKRFGFSQDAADVIIDQLPDVLKLK